MPVWSINCCNFANLALASAMVPPLLYPPTIERSLRMLLHIRLILWKNALSVNPISVIESALWEVQYGASKAAGFGHHDRALPERSLECYHRRGRGLGRPAHADL